MGQKDVIKYLEDIRLKEGITLKEFSKKIGISPNSYRQYEIGTHTPRFTTLIKIEMNLGLKSNELIKIFKN